MKKITFSLTTIRIAALSLMMVLGMFFSSTAYGADITYTATTGDWTNANWSPQSPVNGDNIIIPAGAIVTVSTDVSVGNTIKFNKITLNGKLVISSTGALNIEQTVLNSPIVDVSGGELVNLGTLTVKQTLANNTTVCLQFSDNATNDSKFTSTGVFSIDNTSSSNASTSGRCISFNQTTAGRTAQLTLGGTLNFTVKTSTRFIELVGGQAQIDGTFTIGSTSDYKNWRFLHMAPVNGMITFATTANVTMYTAFDSTNGCININAGTAGTVTLDNKGTLNILGGGSFASSTPYGISINPQATSTTSSNGILINEGILNINGNFPGGCLFLTGANFATSYPKVNNTGTINLTNTYTGTGNGSALRTTINTAQQTVVLNNNAGGTMSLVAANTYAISFGLYGTVNNSGLISVNKPIVGSSTTVIPVINNNANGEFKFDELTNASKAIDATTYKLSLINSGGKVTGRGVFGLGTFNPSTGTLSPGGDTGIGSFTFSDPSLTLTGSCNMNVNGITTAGTDYDQIVSTGTLDVAVVSLTMTVGGGYTPVNSDLIPLFSATSRTGNFSAITAPSKWVSNYTSTTANLLFDTSTGIDTKSVFNGSISASQQTIRVTLNSDAPAQFELTDMTGRLIQQITVKGQNNVIPAASLKGVFIARIRSAEGIYSQKIIL
jgi:hypothetical protein